MVGNQGSSSDFYYVMLVTVKICVSRTLCNASPEQTGIKENTPWIYSNYKTKEHKWK